MVNVNKGVLISCDPAMKQFLIWLDETSALGSKFIVSDLDDTHLFVAAEIIPVLRQRIEEELDKLCPDLVE